jgi:hypothetical protein
MPVRLWKSFRVAKGVRLNVSGSGVGTRAGPFTVSTRGRGRSSGSGGCLAALVWPIQMVWWLYKALFLAIVWAVMLPVRLVRWSFATPKRREWALIALGLLAVASLVSVIAGQF